MITNEKWPSDFAIVVLGGFSAEIPDSTPVLLQSGANGNVSFFESFLNRLKNEWGAPRIIAALPEEDKTIPELHLMAERLPSGIEIWYGQSFDVVSRLFMVMNNFSLKSALKLRAKDFLADYGINRKLADAHIESGNELTWAKGAANGLSGICVSFDAIRKFIDFRTRKGLSLGFSSLWSNELGLQAGAVTVQQLDGMDLVIDEPEDLCFLKEIENNNALGNYELIAKLSAERDKLKVGDDELVRRTCGLVADRIKDFFARQPGKPTLLCLAGHKWDDIPQRNHRMAKELSKKFRLIFFEAEFESARKMLGRHADLTPENYWNTLSSELASPAEEDSILLLKAPVSSDFNIHKRNPEFRARVKDYLQYICSEIRPNVIMSYFPQYWDMAEPCLPYSDIFVYDCCDEFSGFTGNWDDVSELEAQMTEHTDISFASSELLVAKLKGYNKNVRLIPNGVNYDYIKANAYSEINPFASDKPVIGFIGGIAEWFDQELVFKAADLRPDWIFLLFGPVLWVDVKQMKARKNIYFMGALNNKMVPYILRIFDVCMIPFKINKLTLSVDPVKLYEYFAAGKPVVSTKLPEVLRYSEYVSCVDSPESFVEAVNNELKRKDSADFKRAVLKIAAKRDWTAIGEEMAGCIMTTLKAVSGTEHARNH